MSYQVLARKWRPQKFDDVVGQQHILTALTNGLSLGRLHHAYLFSGTRGVGKTSIARLFAKGLNCETNITATPCGKCSNCLEIEQGRFIDLLEIDAASRTKVEDTRDLLDNVQYAPARGRFKVYLIDEVHMLSRHSFNALLKTLEEPPDHVKFLLATTDPQKLPITILSRSLQFHLKVLDVEQIRLQLEKILLAESISFEQRALQLLAKAADGSMRDALSLMDQAIAMGNGIVSVLTVSQMLGTLDDEQPIALAEALMLGDGVAMMEQLSQASELGIDWENLLIETLALLHQVAICQLLPTESDRQQLTALRIKELARQMTPQDLQLYYQTLLIGRKELAFAPNRRMGVEMAFLRALAFHPKIVITDKEDVKKKSVQASKQILATNSNTREVKSDSISESVETIKSSGMSLPESTTQLLQARNQLMERQKKIDVGKNELTKQVEIPSTNSALKRLNQATKQAKNQNRSFEPELTKKNPYQWIAQQPDIHQKKMMATTKTRLTGIEGEKKPELIAKLAEIAIERDPWAAEINALILPKLVEQLALNTFKEQLADNKICLHLRTAQRHLNTDANNNSLAAAISHLVGYPVTLEIIENDNPNQRTPLEWRQMIYEEKLAQAKKSIADDEHLQTLYRLFDAELDEESIQPI